MLLNRLNQQYQYHYQQSSTGVAGGQSVIGGTGVADILSLKGTTGNGTLTSPAIEALVGNNGGTIAMTILNNGYVGIGTTNPGAALEVAGQIKITGGAPAAGRVLTSDINGLATWTSVSGVGGVTGTGIQNFITKWTDTSTIRASSIFDNGQIGIGTTSPLSLLSIGLNSDVQINATGDITARTFNGKTISTGSGTLTMGLILWISVREELWDQLLLPIPLPMRFRYASQPD